MEYGHGKKQTREKKRGRFVCRILQHSLVGFVAVPVVSFLC